MDLDLSVSPNECAATAWTKSEWSAALLLLVAVVTTYGTVTASDFVSYDDNVFVTDNANLRAGLSWDGICWALYRSYFEMLAQTNTSSVAHWHPLVWLSYLLDYQLYGLAPWGYHLTNLLWHLASTLVLFAALRRLTGNTWPSLLVAMLFGIHPLNVQAVAWISERKGVISAFFWMLTLWAYALYVERPSWRRYALVAAAFALGLQAKQTVLTLPCVLLLLDYWPLGRWGASTMTRLVFEKLPLFAIACGITGWVLFVQWFWVAQSEPTIPLGQRLANGVDSYVAYLRQAIVPIDLAPYYPHPYDTLPPWRVAAGALLLASVTIVVLYLVRSRPYLAVGWFWYLGTLLPVSGVVQQLGSFARADRYVYVPMIGIFLAAVWAIAEQVPQRLATALAVPVIVAFMVASGLEVRCWKNSLALWQHAIESTGENLVACNNLGVEIKKIDKLASIPYFRASSRFDALAVQPHANLAEVYADLGNLEAATRHQREVVRLDPASDNAHVQLGRLLLRLGHVDVAAAEFEKALELCAARSDRHRAEIAELHNQLGLCRFQQGRLDAAAQEFRRSIQASPINAGAHTNLGTVYAEQQDLEAAAAEFQQALRLDPAKAEAYLNLGIIQDSQGRSAEALVALQKAIELTPNSTVAHRELAFVLERLGRTKEAEHEYQESLRLDATWPQMLARAAWQLATHADAKRRNATRAMRLATMVCQATGNRDAVALDVAAAAYADAGRFADAIASARRAQALAVEAGHRELARDIEARLALYEKSMPFRGSGE